VLLFEWTNKENKMGRMCIMHWDKKHKILFEEPNRILEELRWSALKIWAAGINVWKCGMGSCGAGQSLVAGCYEGLRRSWDCSLSNSIISHKTWIWINTTGRAYLLELTLLRFIRSAVHLLYSKIPLIWLAKDQTSARLFDIQDYQTVDLPIMT